MHPYLETIEKQVVIGDGAFGTHIQSLNLTADDFGYLDDKGIGDKSGKSLEGCNELLCLTRPEIISEMHTGFLELGVDFITTATFGGSKIPLGEYGLEDKVYEINFAGAKIARECVDKFTISTTDKEQQKSCWVAGSMGPGTKAPTLGLITYDELRVTYKDQAKALIEGGVDFLLVETVYDLLSAKAAIAGCKDAMAETHQVPIQVQITIEQTGRMLLGTETIAALTALEPLLPDVIGLNCATGPQEMGEHLRTLSRNSPVPISCIPNAGLPRVEDGATVYDLGPTEFASYLKRYITELGINIVGGCCGTTKAHIEAVLQTCADLKPASRKIQTEPSVSSLYSSVPFKQEASFLIIGERSNATGSKKFATALEADDLEACVAIGLEQINQGAHVIDLNVDYVGRDGVLDMDNLAKKYATEISAPLVLDSSQPEVLESGLKRIGGRAILNSANLEDGQEEGSRLDQVFKLAKQFGAAVMCILIDEEGQARDLEWKLKVTERIYNLATEKYGLRPQDLIFDPLAFPITTGEPGSEADALETIKAIKEIKSKFKGVYTSLGISNVSFGTKPAVRAIINSVFLNECIKAGLDAAIIHAGNILPLNQIEEEQLETARDLVLNKRPSEKGADYDPLLKLLNITDDQKPTEVTKEDLYNLPLLERLSERIIRGNVDKLDADLDKALDEGLSALEIVNDTLLSGMKVVGDLFGKGEMQLPFVLKSAECMKTAVSYLEPYMEKTDASGRAQIVLATVQGDVHDIGKNLVDIILTNNGFTVHNLGIKISIGEIIEKALETNADAIGMSGLLVKSTLIMGENLQVLNEKELDHIPVLLGGAALKRSFVENDLKKIYNGDLYYSKDAFEGLSVMEELAAKK